MKSLRHRVSTPARSLSTRWGSSESRGTLPEGTIGRRLGDFRAAVAVPILMLFLTACQTPAVKDRVVEVRVPVAVQPIKPDQVPIVPAPLAKRPASLSAAADLLLAKVCELEAYALKADPLLRLSAGMPQQALGRFPECER
jgi:hypothetical protein